MSKADPAEPAGDSRAAPEIITVDQMGYIEALDCHTASGKLCCAWCKKPATYFVRQSYSAPDIHMALAPKCIACMGLEEPEP